MKSKRRSMGYVDATANKSKKFLVCAVFVAALFGIAYLMQPVTAVEYFDENYQVSDYQGMFNYSAPVFDHRPLVVSLSGTVNNSPIQMTGEFQGNISVVSRPVGWDLVVPILIYQAAMLTVIAILLGVLTLYFLLRLHK